MKTEKIIFFAMILSLLFLTACEHRFTLQSGKSISEVYEGNCSDIRCIHAQVEGRESPECVSYPEHIKEKDFCGVKNGCANDITMIAYTSPTGECNT